MKTKATMSSLNKTGTYDLVKSGGILSTPRWSSFRNSLCYWIIIFFNNKKIVLRVFVFLCVYFVPSSVGNAMGYIRMIRSGGLHCCSNAIRYNVVHSCPLVLLVNFAFKPSFLAETLRPRNAGTLGELSKRRVCVWLCPLREKFICGDWTVFD